MMTKIINAKSQIGKTEKSESEMMLLFWGVNSHSISIINNRTVIGRIKKIDGLFCFVWLNMNASSDHLRQIADKLDELNGSGPNSPKKNGSS